VGPGLIKIEGSSRGLDFLRQKLTDPTSNRTDDPSLAAWRIPLGGRKPRDFHLTSACRVPSSDVTI